MYLPVYTFILSTRPHDLIHFFCILTSLGNLWSIILLSGDLDPLQVITAHLGIMGDVDGFINTINKTKQLGNCNNTLIYFIRKQLSTSS